MSRDRGQPNYGGWEPYVEVEEQQRKQARQQANHGGWEPYVQIETQRQEQARQQHYEEPAPWLQRQPRPQARQAPQQQREYPPPPGGWPANLQPLQDPIDPELAHTQTGRRRQDERDEMLRRRKDHLHKLGLLERSSRAEFDEDAPAKRPRTMRDREDRRSQDRMEGVERTGGSSQRR